MIFRPFRPVPDFSNHHYTCAPGKRTHPRMPRPFLILLKHVMSYFDTVTYKMVLGIAAGIGAVLAGVGIYKGSSRAGKAAQSVADSTAETLAALRNDVKQVRTFLIEEAWPDVNTTLVKFQGVLDRAEELILTLTFTTKVLALLIFLCAALVCKHILSKYARQKTTKRGESGITVTLEEVFLQLMYWICLLMAGVLVFHLIGEVLHITWPNRIPFLVIIPSLTMLGVCLQYLMQIVNAILMAIMVIIYYSIGLPFNLIWNPIFKGSHYTRYSSILSTLLFILYILLYFLIPYLPMLYLKEFLRSQNSVLEVVLVVFVVFYVTAIIIHIVGEALLFMCVRPMWAFFAKRSHFQ